MASFTLGNAPHRMTLVLSRGTDFVASLTRNDGVPWPTDEGVSVYLEIGGDEYPAALIGATASWDIDEEMVDAIILGDPRKARLYYTDGTTTTLWAAGPVVIQ